MYKKLKTKSKGNKIKKNELLEEFEEPVNKTHNRILENFEKYPINEIINESIEKTVSDIASQIISTSSVFVNSKNVKEIAKMCQRFFQDSNFGTFEYIQKTGRSSFRVEHSSGSNGTKFLKKFFEKIFNTCLKDYSVHIISDKSHVCVIFR